MSIASQPRPNANANDDPLVVPVDGEAADPPLGVPLLDDPPAGIIPPPLDYITASPSLRGGDRESRRGEWDSDSQGGSSRLYRHRPQPRPDALTPKLALRQLPLVATLAADLVRETAGRGQFSAYVEEDCHTAAMTLVRYRLSTLPVIRQTDRGARRMFLPDLREMGRKAFPEMHLPMQLLAHFAPVLMPRANP